MSARRIGQYIIVVFILLISLEVASRSFLKIKSGYFFPSVHEVLVSYYPVLNKVNNWDYDTNRINILILGGSVVYPDTVPGKTADQNVKATFCSFNEWDPGKYNVLNLAFPAHTTLDSRYKLEYLMGKRFDYVFIYHGINDVRANHIDAVFFDNAYRHIEYYDELYVLKRHQELPYISICYSLDLLWSKVRVLIGMNRYIPEYRYDKVCFQHTRKTFKANYLAMIDMVHQLQAIPVIFTFANYQPTDYSKEKFLEGKLDYATNYYPTELYGSADCVPGLIQMHNAIIKQLAKEKANELLFYDLEQHISKDKYHFMDICHLTTEGCRIMYNAIDSLIGQHRAEVD